MIQEITDEDERVMRHKSQALVKILPFATSLVDVLLETPQNSLLQVWFVLLFSLNFFVWRKYLVLCDYLMIIFTVRSTIHHMNEYQYNYYYLIAGVTSNQRRAAAVLVRIWGLCDPIRHRCPKIILNTTATKIIITRISTTCDILMQVLISLQIILLLVCFSVLNMYANHTIINGCSTHNYHMTH